MTPVSDPLNEESADRLQRILDAVRGGSYEAYVTVGRDVVGAQNRNRVLLAELSRDVGDDDRYRNDIADGNIEARTLRSYRHVVDYYGGAARVCRYLDQGAGWKVMSVTASHFGDSGKDDAYAFIEHTLTNRTTYREAVRTLREGQPQKPTLAEELAAKLARLLDAVDGVPELLETAADDAEELYPNESREYRAKAQAIRAALVTETAAGAANAQAGGKSL